MVMFEVWAPGHQRVELVLAGQRRLAMAAGSEVGGVWTSRLPLETVISFPWTAGRPAPTPVRPGSPMGLTGLPSWSTTARSTWSDQDWHGALCPGPSSTSFTSGPSARKGRSTGPSPGSSTWSNWASTPSSCCPWPRPAGAGAGVTTAADLWAPHHAYGGPDGLKRLVDACHARGVAVVLDVVYNHLGPAGNYLSEFGPYFTDDYRTPWGSAVNMDGKGSYGVRDFVISNALMWLRDYHFDGLRLDAVHAIYDESALHHP